MDNEIIAENLFKGPDGESRCAWCSATSEYVDYHDKEWGFPVSDDQRLFEKICLESFQSGLSWRTILAKRENFRNSKVILLCDLFLFSLYYPKFISNICIKRIVCSKNSK